MNDVQSSVRRTFKYLIPVFIISVVINLPKFFEAKVITYEDKNGNECVELAVTELRKNPDYAIYYRFGTSQSSARLGSSLHLPIFEPARLNEQ